jgi:hypothetical protein
MAQVTATLVQSFNASYLCQQRDGYLYYTRQDMKWVVMKLKPEQEPTVFLDLRVYSTQSNEFVKFFEFTDSYLVVINSNNSMLLFSHDREFLCIRPFDRHLETTCVGDNVAHFTSHYDNLRPTWTLRSHIKISDIINNTETKYTDQIRTSMDLNLFNLKPKYFDTTSMQTIICREKLPEDERLLELSRLEQVLPLSTSKFLMIHIVENQLHIRLHDKATISHWYLSEDCFNGDTQMLLVFSNNSLYCICAALSTTYTMYKIDIDFTGLL